MFFGEIAIKYKEKKTQTILLIITNFPLLSLLYIGYQKIQRVREQSLSGSVCQGHPTREKLWKGKDVQVQEGILGLLMWRLIILLKMDSLLRLWKRRSKKIFSV